ncbi:cyclin-T2a isoform X2 [Amia ocellicauda]|uniref:cyclin-T2a isoform X2 n=1 Tax=Amia ocellicauda TaxID=2972642 RepID=UPI0034645EFE
MAACRGSSSRWFFTREQLEATPSRRSGVEPDRELSYRQQAANLIQDMGQRLNVSQLTINTAIVYMHRFYMYHSFTKFHRNIISPTTLFLAAKVEEQPRKLEHVIKVAHACLNPQEAQLDTKSNAYLQQAQELVILETIVLQTLGFEITIEHPHTDVVKCSQLVRASKDLAQTSYFMATNSLHLTTFCLQYKPTVIACVCIHLACKWSNWEIPVSTDGKHWWEYVDPSVTLELLDELTHEFLQILEKTPSRLKRIRNWRANQAAKKPKSEGQVGDNSFPGPSLVQNASLVDSITGVSTNTTFPKASTSTSFPVTLSSNSGHSLDTIASVTTNMQSTSYNFTAPNDWSQQQDQGCSEMYTLKPEALSIQQGVPVQLHTTLHHRPDKSTDFPSSKHEHKSSTNKHHPLLYPPPVPPPQKMSLDKYREKHAAELAVQKRKLEGLDVEIRDPYAAQVLVDQPHHKKHAQPQLQPNPSCSSVASPIKMKIPLANPEKPDKHPGDKKDKSGSLKLRIPIPPTEKSVSKEELKMKIKVSSERHSSSDEGSGKSKHSSPHVGREHKDKHRDHSSHRHHGSHKHSHLHAHLHSGNMSAGGKLGADGTVAAALRSPVVLGSEGGPSGSSSSRKRLHPDVSHNHHSKMSKSSKSSGSSSHSSSVKQYVSSHNSVLNLPFPPPPPVTYQVGYGHLSTLVKLDKKPVETNGPDATHEFNANSQHMDYKDTFDMLDSLLSAQGMNM